MASSGEGCPGRSCSGDWHAMWEGATWEQVLCKDIGLITTKNESIKDPIKNLEEKDVGIGGDAIHIHYSTSPRQVRRTYIDGNFVPMTNFDGPGFDRAIVLKRSGIFLLEKADIVGKDPDGDQQCAIKGWTFFDDGGWQKWHALEDGEVPPRTIKELVKWAYKDSIYPTEEEVLKCLDEYNPDEGSTFEDKKQKFEEFVKKVKNTYTISLSNLFSKFGAGVYYSLQCRYVCGASHIPDARVEAAPGFKLRREDSAVQQQQAPPPLQEVVAAPAATKGGRRTRKARSWMGGGKRKKRRRRQKTRRRTKKRQKTRRRRRKTRRRRRRRKR